MSVHRQRGKTVRVTSLYEVVPRDYWQRMGMCDSDGYEPLAGKTPTLDYHYRPPRRVDPQFKPRDDDFVATVLRYPALLDTLESAITDDPYLMDSLLYYPHLLGHWTTTRPEGLEVVLLAASLDLVTKNERDLEYHVLTRWQKAAGQTSLPAPLASASAMIDGLRDGHASVRDITEGRARSGRRDADSLTALVADLVVAASLGYSHPDHERSGARRQLRRRIATNPSAWVALTPWLLQTLGESRLMTEGTFWALEAGADPLPALRRAAIMDIETVRLRAGGVLEMLDNGGDPATVVAKLARLLDDGRGHREFPRSLSEPTSTWMSDLELEEGFRSAVREAESYFADEFATQAGAEEESHVGSLLTRIEDRLRARAETRALTSGLAQPVELSGSYRKIPKREEATIKADLALLVRIDVYGRLKTVFADFVQVKKSYRGPVALDADRWRVDLDQLDGLLGISSTAVYWLIAGDGSILVIPAKLVQGVARGEASATASCDVPTHCSKLASGTARADR